MEQSCSFDQAFVDFVGGDIDVGTGFAVEGKVAVAVCQFQYQCEGRMYFIVLFQSFSGNALFDNGLLKKIAEAVISDLAVLFRDYTLKADDRLKSLQQAETISDVTPVPELSHEFRDTEPIDIDQEQNGEPVAATNPEKLSEDAERKTSETESSSIRLAVLAVSAGLTVMLTGILISRKKNR